MADREELVADGDAVQILAREYAEAVRRTGGGSVYVQHPRDGVLQYETFRYLPDHHFRTAYDRLLTQPELELDGGYDTLHTGRRTATVYYWVNPETGGVLAHTEVNNEETVLFFPDEATAMEYLEKRAGTGKREQYAGLSLYQARSRKVGDAVDVLTDQSEFGDFVPDGGTQYEYPSEEAVVDAVQPSDGAAGDA